MDVKGMPMINIRPKLLIKASKMVTTDPIPRRLLDCTLSHRKKTKQVNPDIRKKAAATHSDGKGTGSKTLVSLPFFVASKSTSSIESSPN